MKKAVSIIILSAITLTASLTLSACDPGKTIERMEEYIKATEKQEKVVEDVMPTAEPIGNPDREPGYADTGDFSSTSAMDRLVQYINPDSGKSAKYKSTVKIKDIDFDDPVDFYVFDVFTAGKDYGNYYVLAQEEPAIIYDSAQFRERYFDGAQDAYPVSKASADLLAYFDNKAGYTVDYLTTVTVDDEDLSGEVHYYCFSLKRGGTHLENYYVLASKYGGVIVPETEFNN